MGVKGSGRLTVARLHGRRVLGIEETTIDLGTITVLEGKNASGKSSHLALLRSVLGVDRTSLARLERVEAGPTAPAGAEEEPPYGEVLLVGEDREVRVSKTGGDTAEVAERDGDQWRKVPRPAEWLRSLVNVSAASPAAWLAMNDEDKATAILEACPLERYSRTEALRVAGLEGFRLPAIPAGLHPLEDLELVEKAVFMSRTEVNRQRDAEHDAATKLLAGLPAQAPADAGVEVAELEARAAGLAADMARQEAQDDAAEREAVAAARNAYTAEEQRVAGEFKAEAAKMRRAFDARAAEIRAEAERRIAADQADTDRAILELQQRGEATLDERSTEEEAAVSQARERRDAARVETERRKAELAAGRERLASLRAQQQAVETDRHVRATADAAEAKARQHGERSAALTAALEALTRYKLQLAESLPIKGLAVHFDERGRKSLTLDRVPLDQVNAARRYSLAVEQSLLRNRPALDGQPYLPVVLLDDAEKLDPETRAGVLREIASRGSQVIAAVVSPTTFRVLRGEDALSQEVA